MTIDLYPVRKEAYSEAETLGAVGKNFPGATVQFKSGYAVVECRNGQPRFAVREILDGKDFDYFQARIRN